MYRQSQIKSARKYENAFGSGHDSKLPAIVPKTPGAQIPELL